MLELNVNNETSKLLAVILGTAKSNGPAPMLEECYDPKSRENVLANTYPIEIDMVSELNQLEDVLVKHNVKVYRPEVINDYNQIFSRDIGFVIDNFFIVSNILAAIMGLLPFASTLSSQSKWISLARVSASIS